MTTLPTGTVTFLFTDIEGSTRLLRRLGGPRYAEVLAQHQRLLRTAFAAHAGHEVDTQGDSFFVTFPTAPDALAAAADATRALAAYSWPEGVETLRVRMGLHTGAPQLTGDNYVGLDVHRAARIAACGHGGQILLSAAAAELVRHDLPEGITLRDLGAHRLKDLQQAERVYQAVLADVPNLPTNFPDLKALDARPNNVPVQPSPILGREREVAAVVALLRREDGSGRLVTLTGPGGIGKTRLSLQVAAEALEAPEAPEAPEALDAFPDGVWHVRLSRLTDPVLVIATIATTLDLKESGATPLAEVLRAYLRDKRLLLVLDNFEQVVEAAPQVAELLESSPGVKALVTSRVALHLRGEHEYALRPLALPDPSHLPPPERLSQYAAVALFIERAQAAQADFAVTNATAPAVAAICARLDGLPLAIELAAARVKLLPPPALLKRLERALPVLTGGARDLDARQQTMRNTLAWSYDLLASQEQRLFRRLAVFVGGWTLEAAEAVCVAPEGVDPLELDLLDGLSRLVDHSLIQQRAVEGEAETGEGADGEAEPRFGMLYVIREYALEQLEASGEADKLRQAHGHWCLVLAEAVWRGSLEAPAQEPEWLERLDREQDNLRAALAWTQERAASDAGMRLATALAGFWMRRGHLKEGRTWTEGMLALRTDSEPAGSSSVGRDAEQAEQAEQAERVGAATVRAVSVEATRARALVTAGMLAVLQREYAAAEPWLEQGLALARKAGDLHTAAVALDRLGVIASDRGEPQRGAVLLEESLALHRETDSWLGVAMALNNLGTEAYNQGDLERAAAYFAEALTLGRELGDRSRVALELANLGDVARRRGEMAQAEALMREALELDWKLRNPLRCAEDLECLACTAAAGAEHGERAARLLGAAAALREMLGAPPAPLERADIEQSVAAMRATLGEDAWAAAFAAGRVLRLEDAIAEALGDAGPPGG